MMIDTQVNLETGAKSSNTIPEKNIPEDTFDCPEGRKENNKPVKGNREINPRKLELIELSKTAKALIDIHSDRLVGLEGELTINNVIKHVFYPPGEYNLFKGWKALGYSVKKGAKGFPIWGKKRTMSKKDAQTGEESEFEAFPLAYIFHESQVEHMEKENKESTL